MILDSHFEIMHNNNRTLFVMEFVEAENKDVLNFVEDLKETDLNRKEKIVTIFVELFILNHNSLTKKNLVLFKLFLDGLVWVFNLSAGQTEGVHLGYIVYTRIYILDIHHCRIISM